jgi:hypothetical protein
LAVLHKAIAAENRIQISEARGPSNHIFNRNSKIPVTFALSIRGALFVKQTQKRAENIPIRKGGKPRQKDKRKRP